jgi:hypothetical protein
VPVAAVDNLTIIINNISAIHGTIRRIYELSMRCEYILVHIKETESMEFGVWGWPTENPEASTGGGFLLHGAAVNMSNLVWSNLNLCNLHFGRVLIIVGDWPGPFTSFHVIFGTDCRPTLFSL